MRVMVIGATGVLGRPLVRRLLAEGHEVSGLARGEDRVAAVRATGAKPVTGSLFDVDSLAAALRGHDAVVNVATRIPDARRAMRPSGWAENDRVRIEGSRTLAAAVRQVDEVGVVVQEGISFVYADGGDRELDEDAPLSLRDNIASSTVAHANVAELAAEGRTAIRLRIGNLVGDDAMTRTMLAAARRGAPLIIGRRTDWTAPIHPDDAAAGAIAALRAPSGVYNLAADPVRKQELGAAMAAAAGVRRARALPKWLADRLGVMSVLARSQRVVSTRLTEATGWRPERPVPRPSWF
ncbi:NAD-dependent epimerase/dehydratase family protein [Amycolatopsis regifaucium]|uniref:NAD-dependent dehydratase n=1 Tax=Amycolatopsis regifaucium TaxID=546365 RepID=A0A154MTR9_9PSEU|nr:NAD-dependent epimerase/dehydratase family protein [Amycolatopsis regifaucium]KZB87686.1 NAD-dependent dehydratase [Amycolatopsis regifaucium]OKA05510.1 NAD-dependent dehydratase [Amycolatopsis regifaucium]SFI12985.1 Nucleoside-diphosphate-sugar epimerase [Amycolatopsis regifaucium]